MGITPLDCTGCGNCAQVCPATRKSISYETTRILKQIQIETWNYLIIKLPKKENPIGIKIL